MISQLSCKLQSLNRSSLFNFSFWLQKDKQRIHKEEAKKFIINRFIKDELFYNHSLESINGGIAKLAEMLKKDPKQNMELKGIC